MLKICVLEGWTHMPTIPAHVKGLSLLERVRLAEIHYYRPTLLVLLSYRLIAKIFVFSMPRISKTKSVIPLNASDKGNL